MLHGAAVTKYEKFMFKMKKFFKSKVFYILLVFSITISGIFFIGPDRIIYAAQQTYNKWMILTMILEKVERFYVEEKSPDELIENGIRGILSGLDGHSVYLTPEEYTEWKTRFEGYHGIGLKYNVIDGALVVTSLVNGGPSDMAGIEVGDRIIEIEGQNPQKLVLEEIQKLLAAQSNSAINLVIKRNGDPEPLIFYVKRKQILEESIPCACILNDTSGYIKIARFTESTPTELDMAFAKLNGRGMKQLILDLRDNGGGAFKAGVAVADRFIKGGKLIVFTKGRAPRSTEQYMATDSKSLPEIPMIVLVNRGTASDAEIVAGAIQDWDRGLIVGTRTFGKASVQTEFSFQDGSALLLTTAQYYTPLGRSIQRDEMGTIQEKAHPIIQRFPEKEKSEKKFKTPKGRIVFGGGGITPDITLKSTYTKLSDAFKRIYFSKENYFFKYADQYVNSHQDIPVDLDTFLTDFKVSSQMLREFRQEILQGGTKFTVRELNENSKQIKLTLKREIAGRLWGEEAKYMVDAFADRNIRECVKFFSKAKKLIS